MRLRFGLFVGGEPSRSSGSSQAASSPILVSTNAVVAPHHARAQHSDISTSSGPVSSTALLGTAALAPHRTRSQHADDVFAVPPMFGGMAPKRGALAARPPVVPVARRPAAHHKGHGKGRYIQQNNPRTQRSSGHSEKHYDDWGTFRKDMKEWASTLVPGKVLRMHSEPKTNFNGHFKYKLMCTSCETCRKQLSQHRGPGEPPPARGWNAYVEYNNGVLTKVLPDDNFNFMF